MPIITDYSHPASFKAAVALAAYKGEQTPSELAVRFGVTLEQIDEWRRTLLDGAAQAFLTVDDNNGADAALLNNRQLALTIAENSTQGFAMMDGRGFCIYANRAWLRMTGYTAEEIGSAPLHNLVHHHRPDGRPYPMAECPIDRALPENFEVRAHEDLFFRKDGSMFSVLCAASPVFEKGRPVATVIEIRDITDRKLAEERERRLVIEALAAAEANAKFRTFFEQGSYFAGVMALDGTLIEVNRLLIEASGFSRDDLIGKKFWECGWWSRSAALVDMIEAGSRQAAKGRQFRQETSYFLADGSERVVDLILAPVTDADGKVLFVALTGNDITERKMVEERLRLLDAMSESTRGAMDAVEIMETTTRLLGEHLGVTRCAYADLEPDNDRFTIRHDWTSGSALSTVGVYSLDLFGPRAAADMRSGRTLTVRDVDTELDSGGAEMFNAIGVKAIICCPLVKQGRLAAMMAVHQDVPRSWSADDITLVEEVVERSWAHIERVRATEALLEANRRKSEFLATLAHELRNPLAPIRTGLQMMRLSSGEPESVAALRDMMERQIGQMVRLIDDLLDIARITRGQFGLKKERVSLQRIVDAAIETSLPLIESCSHRFDVEIAEPLVAIEVDAVRISQVISNLLNNAAKYTATGGHIALTAVQDGDCVRISITDNGVGIAPDSLDSIFEMFTQAGRDTEQAQSGLGIGLWLARRMLELHGGTIVASSAGIGLGSTFTIALPSGCVAAADQDDGSTGGDVIQIESVRKTAEPAEGLRILVVDDNVDAAETMSALLELLGYTTSIAYDGPGALKVAKTFRPHVVFLDIGLPGMDGYEVARAIRMTPTIEKTALVALTGWGAAGDLARAKAAGFDRHLTKPAGIDMIETVLADISSTLLAGIRQ